MNAEEKLLLDLLMQNGKSHIDFITSSASLPVSKIAATLLSLEFKGAIKSLPGKMYECL
jgi:DNA processing protein